MIVVLTIKEESKIPWYKRLFIRKSNDVTAVIKEYEEIKVLNIILISNTVDLLSM